MDRNLKNIEAYRHKSPSEKIKLVKAYYKNKDFRDQGNI